MQLLNSNQLPCFVEALLKAKKTIELGGDCHTIALALMADLIIARRAHSWNWLQGYEEDSNGKKWDHSWLEYDGWAIDASNLRFEKENEINILVVESKLYREMKKFKRIGPIRDAKETRKYMERNRSK